MCGEILLIDKKIGPVCQFLDSRVHRVGRRDFWLRQRDDGTVVHLQYAVLPGRRMGIQITFVLVYVINCGDVTGHRILLSLVLAWTGIGIVISIAGRARDRCDGYKRSEKLIVFHIS